MSDNDSSSSSSCSCGGCLGALVIGTVIVGTLALGGLKGAWYKIKSTWDYDEKMQTVQTIMDENQDGTLDTYETAEMYRRLDIPMIEGKKPDIKIPYRTLVEFTDQYNQR